MKVFSIWSAASVAVAVALIPCIPVVADTTIRCDILHDFAGGADDGINPQGSLIRNGSTLYGMTQYGGPGNYGIAFRMNIDGNNFEPIHRFAGGPDDGPNPRGDLTLGDSKLYGMTEYGGPSNHGIAFRMDTNGGNFEPIHRFGNGANDGGNPSGNLTWSGSVLYGMTPYGGPANLGTVFRMDTDGSNFQLLRTFTGAPDDGANPLGSLTLDGSVLYGMTAYGGASNGGVAFRMTTDGGGFEVIHDFTGDADDGLNPWGDLTLRDSTLYGMTKYGGPGNCGVVFRMDTDGNDFEVIHGFASGLNDGCNPEGSLLEKDGVLYGMTEYGGPGNYGIVFRLTADGSKLPPLSDDLPPVESDFEVIHGFTGAPDDGANPRGSLTMGDSGLYGMTTYGGEYNHGTIFWIVPEPVTLSLLALGGLTLIHLRRR